MAEPTIITVSWPYLDIPKVGAPVRAGSKRLGKVTAVHQRVNGETTVEITLEDCELAETLQRGVTKGLSL